MESNMKRTAIYLRLDQRAKLQVSDPNVRNLQTVLFNVEADRDMRRRALKQLAHNAKRFDSQDASAVLQQWYSLNLELE